MQRGNDAEKTRINSLICPSALLCALCTLAFVLSPASAAERVQVGCYYFPDYHPGEPLNDRDHGKGWTEWELVKAAKPLFPGHQQPQVPAWGYEDESDPAVMQKKIAAAADAGIDAFIFDWYWYDGKPFLEKALNEGFLKAKNVERLKFSLMWANHDWTDIFPVVEGKPQRLMYPGKVTPEQFDAACDHIIKDYFLHPSYWKIDGKPYFSIYELFRLIESFNGIDNTRAALDRFRAKARAAGLPGIHLNAVVWGVKILPGETVVKNPSEMLARLGFDSATSYVWIHHAWPEQERTDYDVIRDRYFAYWTEAEKSLGVPYFPNVTMGWDPTPRNYQPMRIFTGNTPEKFRNALQLTKDRLERSPTTPKVLTLNCWNEWTEGGYLEPDTVHGTAYLEAVQAVFRPSAPPAPAAPTPAAPRP
jgi:hypothetical protein